MPWSGQSFAKHNHGLSKGQSTKAAKIANHVLASTGDEGEAIATANKLMGKAKPHQLAKAMSEKR